MIAIAISVIGTILLGIITVMSMVDTPVMTIVFIPVIVVLFYLLTGFLLVPLPS